MSRAYYNEIDEYAARWLRNLIERGLIADGDVDTRSIADVTPNDVKGYTQCHFFAGIGGWSAALRRSGVWPDSRPVWTGSCPCQPFSLAGKQGGFDDERHLWPHWQWLISQCRPAVVLGEQVASAAQWLRLVRGDLEALGYAVGAMPIQAASAGADHLRDRFWFVANGGCQRRQQVGRSAFAHEGEYAGRSANGDHFLAGDGEIDMGISNCGGWSQRQQATTSVGYRNSIISAGGNMEYAESIAERESDYESDTLADGGQAWAISGGAGDHFEWVIGADGKARRVKSGIRLLAHGVPARVAKLRAFGNAIDPRPAAQFIKAVSGSIQ
jgi:DNA (cytosine-5)-methyltransferase 1